MVADQSAIDDAALTALGARGIIRPSANAAQIVLGPLADLIAEEIRAALGKPQSVSAVAPTQVPSAAPTQLDPALVAALGGAANIIACRALHGRLRVEVAVAEQVDPTALAGATRGMVQPEAGVFHLLLE
jgi:PTS system N-acetylglucosamine-specific IIC component